MLFFLREILLDDFKGLPLDARKLPGVHNRFQEASTPQQVGPEQQVPYAKHRLVYPLKEKVGGAAS